MKHKTASRSFSLPVRLLNALDRKGLALMESEGRGISFSELVSRAIALYTYTDISDIKFRAPRLSKGDLVEMQSTKQDTGRPELRQYETALLGYWGIRGLKPLDAYPEELKDKIQKAITLAEIGLIKAPEGFNEKS